MRDKVLNLFELLSDIMAANKEYLIDLDSIVGDGDLGLTMSDGFKAAYQAVRDSNETDLGKLIYQAGKAMSTAVPSTMGTLMASGLMQCGKELKGKTELSYDDFVIFFKAFEDGVISRGKAKVGDKTFLDGWHPGVETLEKELISGSSMKSASLGAYEAAKNGFESTSSIIAVHGRAAARGEASKALKDPGAAVAMLMMQAFSRVWS